MLLLEIITKNKTNTETQEAKRANRLSHIGKCFLCFFSSFILAILYQSQVKIASAGNLRIIRDIEIESFLKAFTEPIIRKANLNTANVRFFVIADDAINAFVLPNDFVFVTTGLLALSNNSDALFGVLSHEIGHIKNLHLMRLANDVQSQKYSLPNILLSSALIIGSSLAGSPLAGISSVFISSDIYHKTLLYQSRGYEIEADQFAIQMFENNMRNMDGYYKLLWYLDSLSNQNNNHINEYLMTHPLNEARMAMIKRATNFDRDVYNKSRPLTIEDQFLRIKAKIIGHFNIKNNYTVSNVKEFAMDSRLNSNSSFYTAYESIFRVSSDQDNNIQQIVNLIQRYPNDPYLIELYSDNLEKIGNVSEAINQLRKISRQLNDHPLILLKLAQLLNKTNVTDNFNEAITFLKRAIVKETYNPVLYYVLSESYHKLKNDIQENYYLAEYYFTLADYQSAMIFAQKSHTANIPSSVNYDPNVDFRAKELTQECHHKLYKL